MKNFKFKLLIPVLAIVFALTSAFTTSASTNVDESMASQQAYILNNGICQAKVICTPNAQYACTFEGQEAYGKQFPTAPTCIVVLRKHTP